MANDYPLFRDPKAYLRLRDIGGPLRMLKRRSGWRALDRCFEKTAGISTACDAPCGPGRLFPYWKRRGFEVIGVELSEDFVCQARAELGRLDLSGEIVHGDAFCLAERPAAHRAQLVASVRFIYYFARAPHRAVSRLGMRRCKLSADPIQDERNLARAAKSCPAQRRDRGICQVLR